MKMSLLPVVTLFCILSLSSAWQIIYPIPTIRAIPPDPCLSVTCKALSYGCPKVYRPPGQCCAVCACEDAPGKESGSFTVKTDIGCFICGCSGGNGTRIAYCGPAYCPFTRCPLSHQVKSKDGCCGECKCEDVSGKKYSAGENFMLKTSNGCLGCQCKGNYGSPSAKCSRSRIYCRFPNCPDPYVIKSKDGCCHECKPSYNGPTFFPPRIG